MSSSSSTHERPLRVVCYVDDEGEQRIAVEALTRFSPPSPIVGNGIVEGAADRATIDDLVRKGVSVEILPPPGGTVAAEPAPPPFGDPAINAAASAAQMARVTRVLAKAFPETVAAASAEPELAFMSREARPRLIEPETRAKRTSAPPRDEDVYYVDLKAPLSGDQRRALVGTGGQIVGFKPPARYRMFLTSAQVAAVRELPFVAKVSRYSAWDTVRPGLVDSLEASEQSSDSPGFFAAAPEKQVFDMVLHRRRDLDRMVDVVKAVEGSEILDAGARVIRFSAPVDSASLVTLCEWPEVRSLDKYEMPRLASDVAREVLGVTPAGAPIGSQTGRNQVVAIFDSGIDDTHPDFVGRIKIKEALNGATIADDHVGHGTHVAGIILGTGAASGGTIRGVAPEASLVSIGVCDQAGVMRLPADLEAMLKRAVDHGARIINLSWGYKLRADYDENAAQIDAFAYGNPNVLVLIAAGNEGTASQGRHSLLTLGSPAAAKNAVTVGACPSPRALGPETWHDFYPARFADNPAAAELTAGVVNVPAALSSRGPTNTHYRVKPDVVAPGTYILAPRAAQAQPKLFWRDLKLADFPQYNGVVANPAHYGFVGGTSMATPFASGCAALLRQYLVEDRGVAEPSAALLKALLILSAERLRELEHALVPPPGYPDFAQGFGRVDLSKIAGELTNGGKLAFVDIANDSPDALERWPAVGSPHRTSCRYDVELVPGSGREVRVALVWTDRAGNGLQNSLLLEVHDGSGRAVPGNPDHRFQPDPFFTPTDSMAIAPDRRNNVQMIILPPGPATALSIRVNAANTAYPPQGYALCVLGPLRSEAL